MKHSLLEQTAIQVVEDFGLEVQVLPQSEAALLDLLADVVAHLVEKRLEYFMQILYSMDVDEGVMRYAFSGTHGEPVNVVLARAILEREKKKAATRLKYRPKVPRDWSVDIA